MNKRFVYFLIFKHALGAADKQADSAEFAELMLEIIRECTTEITQCRSR